MKMSTYDSDKDGVIAFAQTEADMKKSVYDPDNEGFSRILYIAKRMIIPIVAGDEIVGSKDVGVPKDFASYDKIKDCTMLHPGTYRIKFSIKNDTGSVTMYGKIYKNGVAFGTERSRSSAGAEEFSEDLVFAAGDICEIYAYSSVPATEYVEILNFRVYVLLNSTGSLFGMTFVDY